MGSTVLQVSVDEDLRARAAAELAGVGLSVPDAARLVFERVVADHGFSLQLRD